MNKLGIFTIPTEVLSEMEALKIQGGAGSEGDGNTFVLASCVVNGEGAYCGNCVTGCGCSPSSGSSSENDGNNENP